MKVFKLTGAGNHFLLVDLCEKKSKGDFTRYLKSHYRHLKAVGVVSKRWRARFAKDICNPYRSIGADGLIFLENSKKCNFKWDFYNADGSRAEMCGNAARCVGVYLGFCGDRLSNPVSVETVVGEILITLLRGVSSDGENFVCVEMPKIFTVANSSTDKKLSKNKIKIGKRDLKFEVINSGVPHVVFDISDLKFSIKNRHNKNRRNNSNALIKIVDNLEQIVDKLRKLTQFKQAGVNVTFYTRSKSGSGSNIESLTFERGVAGYTQACGTGALAAAYLFSKGQNNFITVQVPGGKLAVDLNREKPLLIGPAKIVAEINLI